MELTHIDLFSGIGGFALAARWAGIKTVQFVEIDPFCQKVLTKNFPGVSIHGDIKTFHWTGDTPFLLTGGFPCQDISCAGLKQGITEATRSGLWFEQLRIIRELRPKYAIIENVPALLVRGIGTVVSGLSKIGYDMEWQCISAAEVGAWHKRERVWIVSYPKGQRWYQVDKSKQEQCPGVNMESFKEIWGYANRLFTSLEWPHDKPISGIKRNDDGLSEGVDRLKSLGNAIVPQVAFQIMRAILEVSNADRV